MAPPAARDVRPELLDADLGAGALDVVVVVEGAPEGPAATKATTTAAIQAEIVRHGCAAVLRPRR